MSDIKVGDTITAEPVYPRYVGEKVTGVVVDVDGENLKGRCYRVDPGGAGSESGRIRHVRPESARVVEPSFKAGDIVKFTYSPLVSEEHFFAKVREVMEDGLVVGELYDRGTTRTYDHWEIGRGPIYLGVAPSSNLTKEKPAPKFKVGDRLRGEATPAGIKTGVFEGKATDGWLRVQVEDDGVWYLNPSLPITVVDETEETPALSFVGPEPKPVKVPAVTTPFKADGDVICDSRGHYVGEFGGTGTTLEQDGKLAALVADLLNQHFGVK
jgi:hypothetical protein